jgi:magnesium transporter
MNFEHMPELDEAWGYPVALSLMALVAVSLLAWFKARKWW